VTVARWRRHYSGGRTSKRGEQTAWRAFRQRRCMATGGGGGGGGRAVGDTTGMRRSTRNALSQHLIPVMANAAFVRWAMRDERHAAHRALPAGRVAFIVDERPRRYRRDRGEWNACIALDAIEGAW